jgi:ketosteroid isomerase-like protein
MENTMNTNELLIEQFYSSFAKHDYAAMIACYDPDVQFSDPVFTLSGKKAGAMWHMLCESGKDLTITYKDIQADELAGKAHWEAKYTFGSTGRMVLNIIDAQFQFKNGRIIRHIDHFSFWRWSHQAIGPAGTLLGWTPIVKNQVRTTAGHRLAKFIAQHPEYRE